VLFNDAGSTEDVSPYEYHESSTVRGDCSGHKSRMEYVSNSRYKFYSLNRPTTKFHLYPVQTVHGIHSEQVKV